VEISPSFLKHLNARKRQEELTNVAVVSCSDRHCNLPAGSVDRLLLCDVYHHFEYPQATLSSLYDALKPGGMMVLVDFYREPENVSSERKGWLLGHIRAPLEVFRSEIEQAGFAFRDQVAVSGFKENYLLRFEKPAKNVR
jgi:SAM-dependent methyltransferase